MPETGENGLDGTADLVFGGHIGGHGETADFRGNGLSGCAVAVEHGNRHTLAGQAPRDRASNAAARAGDQTAPPVQGVCHVPILAGLRPASSGKSSSENSAGPRTPSRRLVFLLAQLRTADLAGNRIVIGAQPQ